MKNQEIPLYPDGVYHIVNHANGRENLFLNRGNYKFFLRRYQYFIEPIAETFAYCLMPNHFHLLVQIKGQEALQTANKLFKKRKSVDEKDIPPIDEELFPNFISRTFGRLFSSYTQAFNKQQNRRGSLFIPNFKRSLIDSNTYFRNTIHYIHFNPVKHGFVDSCKDWEFSSYSSYISEKETRVARGKGLSTFKDKTDFLNQHNSPAQDLPDMLE